MWVGGDAVCEVVCERVCRLWCGAVGGGWQGGLGPFKHPLLCAHRESSLALARTA